MPGNFQVAPYEGRMNPVPNIIEDNTGELENTEEGNLNFLKKAFAKQWKSFYNTLKRDSVCTSYLNMLHPDNSADEDFIFMKEHYEDSIRECYETGQIEAVKEFIRNIPANNLPFNHLSNNNPFLTFDYTSTKIYLAVLLCCKYFKLTSIGVLVIFFSPKIFKICTQILITVILWIFRRLTPVLVWAKNTISGLWTGIRSTRKVINTKFKPKFEFKPSLQAQYPANANSQEESRLASLEASFQTHLENQRSSSNGLPLSYVSSIKKVCHKAAIYTKDRCLSIWERFSPSIFNVTEPYLITTDLSWNIPETHEDYSFFIVINMLNMLRWSCVLIVIGSTLIYDSYAQAFELHIWDNLPGSLIELGSKIQGSNIASTLINWVEFMRKDGVFWALIIFFVCSGYITDLLCDVTLKRRIRDNPERVDSKGKSD